MLLTQLWAVKLQTSLSVKSFAQLTIASSTVVSVVKHYKYLHISPYVACIYESAGLGNLSAIAEQVQCVLETVANEFLFMPTNCPTNECESQYSQYSQSQLMQQ